MDGSQFDALSRQFGTSQSRRKVLRAFAGAIVAGVVGTTVTEAQQTCIAKNKTCQGDEQCCDGMVCEWGICKPGCRIDGEFAHPKKSPVGNTCVVCQPEISTSVGVPTKEGKRCYSGDPYAGKTTCQNGVCTADEPASCRPLTACHVEGEVNPATGLCEYPPAPEGTLCGAAEMCHGGFYSPAAACDGNGNCIGGGSQTVNCAPYSCNGTTCATSCATNSDCFNGTTCCEGQCEYLNSIDHCGVCGNVCESVDACTPAFCDDGLCNQTSACPYGSACCDGQCLSLDSVDNCGTCGNVCGDNDACNTAVCIAGECDRLPVADCCLTDEDCNDGVACTSALCVENTCQYAPIDANCDDGNPCTDNYCDEDLGCQSVNNTAVCEVNGLPGTCSDGACVEDWTCEGITPGDVQCVSSDQCGTGQDCINGGCFTACVNVCPEGSNCTDCRCRNSAGSQATYCFDYNFGVGSCFSNEDCPTGSVCNPHLVSSEFGNLCVRPCPTPQPT